MDDEFLSLIKNYVPITNAVQASNAISSREKQMKVLLQHGKIPENGWDDIAIELLLSRLSLLDSNNFLKKYGVGERESRFASSLVAQRHYNFGHGIGRSGDLNEIQPKATGSSVLYKLTNRLISNLFQIMGIQNKIHTLLIPVCTGMGIVLTLLTLKQTRSKAKYVIWSRIDQKSCFKSIITAGFIPIIIDTLEKEHYLTTNLDEINAKITEFENEEILCVITTTSCFAPRICDDIEGVGKICKEFDIPHVINNAYGLQSRVIMKRIESAYTKGRIDLIVQSTDKNLMVPVGGVIIASFHEKDIEAVSKLYPGRASISPIVDVFITLLSLGKNGYMAKIEEREKHFNSLYEKSQHFASIHHEQVYNTKMANPISIAITCNNIATNITKLGSMLYVRNVFGGRVVGPGEDKSISGYLFKNWGTHHSQSAAGEFYLTIAASIGMNEHDIEMCFNEIEKCYKKLIR